MVIGLKFSRTAEDSIEVMYTILRFNRFYFLIHPSWDSRGLRLLPRADIAGNHFLDRRNERRSNTLLLVVHRHWVIDRAHGNWSYRLSVSNGWLRHAGAHLAQEFSLRAAFANNPDWSDRVIKLEVRHYIRECFFIIDHLVIALNLDQTMQLGRALKAQGDTLHLHQSLKSSPRHDACLLYQGKIMRD